MTNIFKIGERVIASYPENDSSLRKEGLMFEAGTVVEYGWQFPSVLFDNGARRTIYPEALEPLEKNGEEEVKDGLQVNDRVWVMESGEAVLGDVKAVNRDGTYKVETDSSVINDIARIELVKSGAGDDLEDTIEQRGLQYGCFRTQASLSQGLKDVIRSGSSYDEMTQAQREAAEMICHKLARIANGNPSHWDSWHDIAGYAELIRKSIEGQDP